MAVAAPGETAAGGHNAIYPSNGSRTVKKWIMAPLLAFALSPVHAQPLNVANWNDYIDPAVLADFTRETGIEVNYRTYDSDQEVYALLKQGEALDVVVPSTDNFGKLIREGLLRPYAAASLPGFEALEPLIMARVAGHDPTHEYGVPYLWGSIGLAVNVPQAEAALGGPVPNTWGLVFDKALLARLSACGVSLLDSANDVTSLLANYQGRSLGTAGEAYVSRVLEQLGRLRPHYRYIDSSRYVDDLGSGKLCVSMAWTGDALAAAAKGLPVKFMVPEEGSLVFVDILAIPAAAKNPEEAQAFIRYMLRPEVSARIARATYYQTPNARARQALEAEGGSVQAARLSADMFGYQAPREEVGKLIDDFWPRLLENRVGGR